MQSRPGLLQAVVISRLQKVIENLRSSLWFVPGGIVVVGIILAIGSLTLDRTFGQHVSGLAHFGPASVSGAYAFLSTLAGGLLGIVGVSFSITIVTFTLASSQFGPRLVRNFMRSTSTQVVLGGLLGVIVFAIIVLADLPEESQSTQLPRVTLSISLLLGLFAIGLFIYFLHHIAISIQADRVVADVYGEVGRMLDRFFPEQRSAGEDLEHDTDSPEDAPIHLSASRTGYLQAVDGPALVEQATRDDLVVHVHHSPGDFVLKEGILAAIAGPGAAQFHTDRRSDYHTHFLLGDFPTPTQDIEFAIRQLVEIALRALSPGINDPFTACNCIDYLGATVSRIIRAGLPRSVLRDGEGKKRVVLKNTDLEGIVGAAFNQIRQEARQEFDVSIHLLDVLAAVAQQTEQQTARTIILDQAEEVARTLEPLAEAKPDRAALDERKTRLRRLAETP